jgi:hypothetical protein
VIPTRRCGDCGRRLEPCEAKLRADGEQTYAGFYPCPCNEAREENAEIDEWLVDRPLPLSAPARSAAL